MKKTIVLAALVAGSVQAADWASLFGGGTAQNQRPANQQQGFSLGDLFGQSQQQPANQQPGGSQPGFMETMSKAWNVMKDPEVKAKSDELKALIEEKISGRRPMLNQAPASQQSAPKAQGGFDWGSLLGGSTSQQQAPQQQTQDGGFAGILKKLLEGAQQ